MYERRRQTASLVSSLVVTSVFVWACSSGGHEDDSVTTSGGAGSEVTAGGGAAISDPEGGSTNGAGGMNEGGSASSMNEAGSRDGEHPDPDPSSAGAPEVGEGGAKSAGGASHSMGGTLGFGGTAGTSAAGVSNAGISGAGMASAGSTSTAGASAIAEPVCDPADDPSTLDMVLPCEVSTALYVCRNCHGKPPVSSVSTSYVTFADIKPHAAQIYGVIKSGTMPWPPYTMSAWQKSTALKWLGKDGSCAIGAAKSCQ